MLTNTDNLGFLLAKASQRWNERLAAGFTESGFPEVRPAYGSVLLPLFEEDGLRIGELTAAARVSKQTMTSLLQQMARDGLIAPEPDVSDRRATRIRLAPRGRAFRPVAERVLAELDELVARAVPVRDLTTTRETLKELMSL